MKVVMTPAGTARPSASTVCRSRCAADAKEISPSVNLPASRTVFLQCRNVRVTLDPLPRLPVGVAILFRALLPVAERDEVIADLRAE